MLQHRKKFFTSLALIALQMCLSLSASAQVLDIDPENGELLLRSPAPAQRMSQSFAKGPGWAQMRNPAAGGEYETAAPFIGIR